MVWGTVASAPSSAGPENSGRRWTGAGAGGISALKPCTWADLTSCFSNDERRSGAALFLPASHPGLPVGWTLRHYGLLNPAWPGVTPVVLNPQEPLVLRYRLWIHRGDVTAGGVQQAYEAYRGTVNAR